MSQSTGSRLAAGVLVLLAVLLLAAVVSRCCTGRCSDDAVA